MAKRAAPLDTNATGYTADTYRFDGFELSVSRRVLQRHGIAVPLGSRALDLLIHLLTHAGRVVSRNDLIQAAWGDRVVEESNLTVQLSALRRALGEKQGDAAFIRTLPGSGYMFVAPVEPSEVAGGQTGSITVRGPVNTVEVLSSDRLAGKPPPESLDPLEPVTLFVGRERELADLAGLLRTNRLVCITSIGGIGKTRLVMRLRRIVEASYPDPITVIDLAPLSNPAWLADVVATALGSGSGNSSLDHAVIAALQSRQSLLILDNAEHLANAVRDLVALVLARCPGMSVVVTSREILGLPGESIFRLLPLSIEPTHAQPPGHALGAEPLTAAAALGCDAVRLFVDRAVLFDPAFVMDDLVAPAILEICQRLDGIALAIEMAVPRLQVLTPRQLADRLHERFRVLLPSDSKALPRQRTLKAMFDWSWELLGPRERRMLQRLAVFAGTASLSALVALAKVDGESEWDALDQLTALVEKSLVVAQKNGPGVEDRESRFRLLETTRQYALDRIHASEQEMLRHHHAVWLAELFEAAEAEWPTTHGVTWLARYGHDTDNLRAALGWAFAKPPHVELGLRLVAASTMLWWELPGLPLRESRHWHGYALARVGPATPAQVEARLLFGQSWTDVGIGDLDNLPAVERAVALSREIGDPVRLGAALWRAGSILLRPGLGARARPYLEEAEVLLRQHRQTKWLALCLIRQGDLLKREQQIVAALALYEEALEMVRALGHAYGLMLGVGNMALAQFELGQRDAAIASMQEALSLLTLGLRLPLAALLATHLAIAGRTAETLEAIAEVVAGAPATGLLVPLARSLETLALMLARAGDAAASARILGFVLTVHPITHIRAGVRLVIFRELDELLATALCPELRSRLIAEGAAWTEADAIGAARRYLGQH